MKKFLGSNGILLVVLVCGMQSLVASGSSVEGKWTFTEFKENEGSKVGCRWLDITTRMYQLRQGVDGRVQGQYTRNIRVQWLGDVGDCPREVSLENIEKLMRIDGWYVQERRRSHEGIEVQAEYDQCVGFCDDETYTLDRFETRLRREGETIVDYPLDGTPKLVFQSEGNSGALEQDASERMFELVAPMYDGRCSQFYEENLHPAVKARSPKGEFCLAARQFSDLMPPVLYHKPLMAFRFDWGEFKRPLDDVRWQIWSGADVLVEQFWTVAADGGGVPIASILRKDEGGVWKVIVPSP